MEFVNQVNETKVVESLELFWRKHIELKDASGLTGAEYCRQNGLVIHQLYYWVSRLKPQHQSSSSFISVKLNSVVAPLVLCSIEFKNGQQLRVHDPVVLPQLVALLDK
jgi:hypothetical protein